MVRWWPEPTAGDIVWCHFPDQVNSRPKPRPALILSVFDNNAPQFTVQVSYGTSQKTRSLYRGEFAIYREKNTAAYQSANLSFDTKFNLKQLVELPFSTEWFSVPPSAPHGQIPRLGVLHPSMVRVVDAAYVAAQN